MLIKFDTLTNRIVPVDRMNLSVREMNDNHIVDVGSKILPMNIQDVFNKATNMLLKDEEMLANFNKNNNSNCNSAEEIKTKLSNMAKGEYIDIHFYPVMYKGSNKNKEKAYVEYNLRKAIIAIIEMEQTLQELVGYNTNIQYMIEREDIKATLAYIGNRLSKDSDLVEDKVEEIINSVDMNFLLTYAEDNKDYIANVKYFIGMDRFLMDRVGFETYNRNEYVQVYIYGGERTDSWTSIKDKNDNLNLFVTPEIKKCLKRIQSLESGRYLHKFLEEVIGNYYDLSNKSTNWNRIKTYINRINDTLPTYYDLESCKTLVKNYFNGLFSLCYTEPSIEESVDNIVNTLESKTLPDFDTPVAVVPQIIEPHIDTNDDQEIDNTEEVLDFEALKAECELLQQQQSEINTNDNKEDTTDFFNNLKKECGND